MTRRCGLIVNPVAGMGGAAALAGSDGVEVQRLAHTLGGRPRARERTVRALRAITALMPDLQFVTGAGALGADACLEAGVSHRSVYEPPRSTTAEDTRRLARLLHDDGVDLILFSGGDGTARDLYAAVGESAVCLGIPAGVKMHSAVFAVTPEHAAPLVEALLRGRAGTAAREVVDIDEEQRRRGRLGSRLYGYLTIPHLPQAVQRGKAASTEGDGAGLTGAAAEVAERFVPRVPCLLGPGTTVREIAAALGVESSLLGVDVLEDGVLTASDLTAAELRRAVGDRRLQVLVSPIGGQGIVLGRGNQQLDDALLERLDPDDLLIVCSPRKLGSLAGRPLLIDAPSNALNDKFRGLRRVITGYRQEAVVRLE